MPRDRQACLRDSAMREKMHEGTQSSGSSTSSTTRGMVDIEFMVQALGWPCHAHPASRTTWAILHCCVGRRHWPDIEALADATADAYRGFDSSSIAFGSLVPLGPVEPDLLEPERRRSSALGRGFSAAPEAIRPWRRSDSALGRIDPFSNPFGATRCRWQIAMDGSGWMGSSCLGETPRSTC